MELSIITVSWNSEDKISDLIKSVVSGCEGISYEHIVVDNGSSDKTVEIIKNDFPAVKLIANKENKGFGRANNHGFEISKGEFVLFLNPDMRVEKGSLKKMTEWMRKNKTVGIASVKLTNENGEPNIDAGPRRFPKVWEQIFLILKLRHIFPSFLDGYLMKGFDFEKEQTVDSVRGSFMFVRREFLEKLGWAFDPRYFIWFEDVDICREAKKAGYEVIYTPIVSCVDFVGQSFKKRESLWKQKNFTKSMLVYFQKWESWHKWIWIWIFRPVGIFLVYTGEKVKNKETS